jgi:two-component system CheB/CheR fusion protein
MGMSLRILLVEDHLDSAEVLGFLLTLEGYRVDVMQTVAETLAVDRPRWDVLVSDLELPDGTGLEVARRLRGLKRAPAFLIALSGYSRPADVENSRKAGFDVHLVKPIIPATLIDLLRGSRLTPSPEFGGM